jgi:hypothetical protein
MGIVQWKMSLFLIQHHVKMEDITGVLPLVLKNIQLQSPPEVSNLHHFNTVLHRHITAA